MDVYSSTSVNELRAMAKAMYGGLGLWGKTRLHTSSFAKDIPIEMPT